MSRIVTRRQVLTGATALSGLLLSGCRPETYVPPNFRRNLVGVSDVLTMATHRLLLAGQKPAPEYSVADISRGFPAEGTTNPQDETYQRLLHGGFREWRLPVLGRVNRPLSLSLDDIRRIPARTQITSHSCEKGWTAIAQWTGAPLAEVLRPAGLHSTARYVMLEAVDGWYDSLDLFDVVHPQTILAYGMNGKELTVPHGAPVRLRVERHVGYKSIKFIKAIHVVASIEEYKTGHPSVHAEYDWHWYAGA